MAALLAADRSPEVIRATPVFLALLATARADGTRACLSGPQLAQLLAGGGTDTTVRRHLKVLREAGWIVQTQQGRKHGNRGYASIYSLSQPSTQTDAWEGGPSRPRRTLQPSTQVDASCSSKEELRPHLGAPSLEVGRYPVRDADTAMAALVGNLLTGGHTRESAREFLLGNRYDAASVDAALARVDSPETGADVVGKPCPPVAPLTPPPGLFPDPTRQDAA